MIVTVPLSPSNDFQKPCEDLSVPEPDSFSPSFEDIVSWRKGLSCVEENRGPEDLDSPVTFSPQPFLAFDDSASDFPCVPMTTLAETLDRDTLLSIPEEAQTQAESPPSLEYGSPISFSIPSEAAVSPILDGAGMQPQSLARDPMAHGPGFANLARDAAPNGHAQFGMMPVPMQHYPDCPSFAHHEPGCPHHDPSLMHGSAMSHAGPLNNGSLLQQYGMGVWTGHYPSHYDGMTPMNAPSLSTPLQPPAQAVTSAASPVMDVQPRALYPSVSAPTPPRDGENVMHRQPSNAGVPTTVLSGPSPVAPSPNGKIAVKADPSSSSPVQNDFMVVPVGSGNDQASQSGSETGHGRKSHYYHAQPSQEDGLYRCAFEHDPSCTHRPTALKCNYDKYIDSHLKPYRCKQKGCEDLRFSSTACRLRHEREAHGSHGHGKNPFVCLYEGCERAKNGFPRSWNCTDHMKRVHGYVPSAEEEAESPTDTVVEVEPRPVAKPSKKRPKKEAPNPASSKKSKTTEAGVQPSKARAATEMQTSAIADVDEQSRLHVEWRQHRIQLQKLAQDLQGPNDRATLEKVREKVLELTQISEAL